MAATLRCLCNLTLVADILFMVLGVADVVLLLLFLLPLASLLSLPRWLLPPLLLPLLPALLAVPVGFLGFTVSRRQHRWKIIGVTALQILLAVSMAVIAGWQVFLWFSPRIEADLTALMTESLNDNKWHSLFYELRCCGPAGPASFQGTTGIPSACCSRDEDAADAPCSKLYTRGCVGPAADRVRAVLRDSAGVHGVAALLLFVCSISSAFFADALKRAEIKRREQQTAREDKPLRSPMLNQQF